MKKNKGGVDISAAEGELTELTGITFNGFALVNGIKNFYLQQHWNAAAPTTTGSSHINTLLTPTVTNNASDNFYNRWDDFRTVTKVSDSYTAAVDVKNTSFTTNALSSL